MYIKTMEGVLSAICIRAIVNNCMEEASIKHWLKPSKVSNETSRWVYFMVEDFSKFLPKDDFLVGLKLIATLKDRTWLSNSDEEEAVYQKYANMVEDKIATIDKNNMITY